MHPDSYFILHLNGNYCIFLSIHFLQMPHQSGKSSDIQPPDLLAEGGNSVDRPSLFIPGQKISVMILFQPYRKVIRSAILPGSEPQKPQFHLFPTGLRNDAVYQSKIKNSFLRLQKFPIYRSKVKIASQGAKRRPYMLFQILQVGA